MKDLEKDFYAELIKPQPNYDNLDKIFNQGIDLNSSNYDSGSIFESLLWENRKNEKIIIELNIFSYLISKGFDINKIDPDTGLNCLINACYFDRTDIFEYLIKQNIFLNNIAFDMPFSMSDKVYAEWLGLINAECYTEEEYKAKDDMLWMIEDTNAKSYDELKTEKIEDFLIIHDSIVNGLLTKDGLISIKNITDDKNIIKKFDSWVIGDYYPVELCHKVKNGKMEIKDFEKHIIDGYMFLDYFKKILPKNIEIKLYSIDFEKYLKENKWSRFEITKKKTETSYNKRLTLRRLFGGSGFSRLGHGYAIPTKL